MTMIAGEFVECVAKESVGSEGGGLQGLRMDCELIYPAIAINIVIPYGPWKITEIILIDDTVASVFVCSNLHIIIIIILLASAATQDIEIMVIIIIPTTIASYTIAKSKTIDTFCHAMLRSRLFYCTRLQLLIKPAPGIDQRSLAFFATTTFYAATTTFLHV